MWRQLDESDLRLLAHHKFKEPERKKMVDDLALQPGNRVLDLGCGIGLWSDWLAEKVAPQGQVVGMDISSASIRIARGRIAAHPHSDVIDFTVADAGAIPFKKGSFDALFCANTLEYFPDPPRYLQEMKRTVRPGGKVAVKDIDAGRMLLYPVRPELMVHIIGATAELVGHRRRNMDEYRGRVLDFFVGRKLHGYFRRVGFQNITTSSYLIQRTQPLDQWAIQHLRGLGQFWLSELVPFLSTSDLSELQELFDEESEKGLLSQPGFYYFDAETVTVGIV